MQSESVVEVALGDETARESGSILIELGSIDGELAANILVALDGVAVVELVDVEPVAHELGVGAGLHVTTMVLVEVVQLVINVDWRLDIAF